MTSRVGVCPRCGGERVHVHLYDEGWGLLGPRADNERYQCIVCGRKLTEDEIRERGWPIGSGPQVQTISDLVSPELREAFKTWPGGAA